MMTVGEMRKALEGVTDDVEIHYVSLKTGKRMPVAEVTRNVTDGKKALHLHDVTELQVWNGF